MKVKGQIGLILFFVALFLILIIGFMAVMVYGVVDLAGDTVIPVMEDLGVAGESTNLSEISSYTFGTMDTMLGSVGWLIGIAYMAALVFSAIFGIVISRDSHPSFIGLYFALMLLLIVGCIIMSNVYEEIYLGGDDLAIKLQEQTLMSYMILHSPIVMVLIALITGIFIFTRQGEGGSFGV